MEVVHFQCCLGHQIFLHVDQLVVCLDGYFHWYIHYVPWVSDAALYLGDPDPGPGWDCLVPLVEPAKWAWNLSPVELSP